MYKFIVLAFIIVSSVVAQDEVAFPPYAAVINQTEVVYVNGDEVVPIDLGEMDIQRILSLTWSEDGRHLAVSLIGDGSYQLMVTDLEQTWLITDTLAAVPPVFDGDSVIYVQTLDDITYDVYQMPLDGESQYLGTLAFELCGGGYSTPMHLTYYQETPLLFAMSRFGIVHPASTCPGAGASVFSLTMGQVIPSDGFTPQTISPDGASVAGVSRVGELQILDLETQTLTTVESSTPVDRVVWAEDGIYFSTWTEVETDFGLTVEQLAQLESEWQIVPSLDFPAHQVALYHVQPDGSDETLLLYEYAWAFARMAIHDGRLFYARIPNADKFLELVLTEGLDYTFTPAQMQASAAELHCVPLDLATQCPEPTQASLFVVQPGE